MDEQALRDLIADVKSGTLSRRSFVQHMIALGLTAPMATQMLAWSGLPAAAGEGKFQYKPTKLHFYSEADAKSACGAAQSAMGPFYCPNDNSIYLDSEFFNELSQKFQAPGDFAEAYVIAHEVGHHVQDLMGTLDQAHSAQARASDTQGNHIQVGIELQADCYAGVWAANARTPEGQPVMQQGDFEEGMRAAQAIGDDTLQRETQGTVVPDSFTHGTSAQRMNALRTGFQSGDPAACDIQKLEGPTAG